MIASTSPDYTGVTQRGSEAEPACTETLSNAQKIMRSLTDVSHSFSHLHNNESRSRFLTGKKGESEVTEG